jgi:hypothetical protein
MSYMRARSGVPLALAILLLLVLPRQALAWVESHQTGDEATIRVEADGAASVRHQIRWHIVRGPFKSFDLVGVDANAVLEPDVPIGGDSAHDLLAHLSRKDDHTLRVTVDEPRSLMRGNFTFDVRWREDFVQARALVRDGATWRLKWSAPVASDGFDSARTVFDLPGAPDAPQPIVADTGALDDAAVSTLARQEGRDSLELVRPHVARGEGVAWTLRIDPRAMARVADPRLRPPAESTPPPEPDRVREVSLAGALVGLALAFALLVVHKAKAFAAASKSTAAACSGLLPLADVPRALLAGSLLAGGVGLQLFGESTAGAACVAAAAIAAALRSPVARPAARGPGHWLVMTPEQAFGRERATSNWLDVGTSAGRVTALLLAVLAVGIAIALRRFDPRAPWLVALDSVAFAPLFLTGRLAQLPPDGVRSAAPWLERAYRKLAALAGLRVAPWARVDAGGRADELRLLVLPRVAMPGVVGVEVGLAWSATPVGWASSPEVLVRVLEGSAAAARVAAVVRDARAVPGRRADERVVRMAPSAPTRAGTVRLVRELARELTDRRVTALDGAWRGRERRGPEAREAARA